MAARRVLRLAERQARSLRPLPRPPQRIGQWREAQGLSPSPSGPGPLRDLPDWSFSDGRPSPPWRGQERRISESRELMVKRLRPHLRLCPLLATPTHLIRRMHDMQIYANEMENKSGFVATNADRRLLVCTGSYWFVLGGTGGQVWLRPHS
nr:39S ribosomal protein L52, mitochondrial isoform X1 [Taeniopygia guttata]